MMDLWDIESRVTSGSRETLEDLDLEDHGLHQAYRGSMDVLGLEVPSMELWDEQCGPNDGFGFCGGINGFIPPKKWKETDDSSSSGIHCDDHSDVQKHDPLVPASVTCVKSVDDYGVSQDGATTKQRRYRKRTKHGRYNTVDDIEYDPEPLQVEVRGIKDETTFRRHTITSKSMNHIVRDDYDKGSVTNLFVCGRSDGGRVKTEEEGISLNRKESVFPYGKVKVRSSSCDELTPRQLPVNESMRSTSQVLFSEQASSVVGNTNRKGGQHKRKSSLFNAVSWLGKSTEFLNRDKSKSTDSVNAYVPDDPNDLKGMTNVKVIATENYAAKGAHELSFKTGQKMKLKQPSMDGAYAFGWKRTSRLSPKKYGYFPLSHVKLYVK